MSKNDSTLLLVAAAVGVYFYARSRAPTVAATTNNPGYVTPTSGQAQALSLAAGVLRSLWGNVAPTGQSAATPNYVSSAFNLIPSSQDWWNPSTPAAASSFFSPVKNALVTDYSPGYSYLGLGVPDYMNQVGFQSDTTPAYMSQLGW